MYGEPDLSPAFEADLDYGPAEQFDRDELEELARPGYQAYCPVCGGSGQRS
jgi:hypothetical protein